MTCTTSFLQHEHAPCVEFLINLSPIRAISHESSLIQKIMHLVVKQRTYMFLFQNTHPTYDVLAANSCGDQRFLARFVIGKRQIRQISSMTNEYGGSRPML